MFWPRLRILGFVTAVGFLLPACKQDEGERCQIDADCGDGLTCDKGTTEKEGICRKPVGTPTVDAAPDATLPDTLPDATSTDATPVDAVSADVAVSG